MNAVKPNIFYHTTCLAMCIITSLFILTGTQDVVAQNIQRVGDAFQTDLETVIDGGHNGRLRAHLSGAVDIKTWDRPQVLIRERLVMYVATLKEATEIVTDSKGSYGKKFRTILIDQTKEQPWVTRTYEIVIPSAYTLDLVSTIDDITIADIEGKVSLTNNGGHVDLKNIGGAVEIRTIDATIHVRSTKGNVKISSNSGSEIILEDIGGHVAIEAKEGSVGTVNLRSIDGGVFIESADSDVTGFGIEQRVEIRIQTGDIKLSDVRDAVYAGTLTGDIDVTVDPDPKNSAKKIELYSTDGNISLSIPSHWDASLNAEVWLVGTQFHQQHTEIISPVPMDRTDEVVEYQRRLIKARGTLNDGRKRVFLKTYGGNIHIHH